MNRIKGSEALRNARNPKASWSTARRRIRSGAVVPLSERRFSLQKSDTILTLGSCFARNIEEHLIKLGCKIPAADFVIPESERVAERAVEILNLFTPPALRQEIEWAAKIHDRDGVVTAEDCEPMKFMMPDGQVTDLGLARISPVPPARYVQRRQELFDLYRHAFTADAVVITPGLVETWFDEHTKRYVNTTPFSDGKLLEEKRFSLHVLKYQQCYDELHAAVSAIRSRNPKAKILLSLSPIPLRYTFTRHDVIAANQFSKSVLGAACQQLCEDMELDYFPSFEAATYSKNVWEKDHRHVRDSFVAAIIKELESRYFHGAPATLPDNVSLNLTDRIRKALGLLAGRERN